MKRFGLVILALLYALVASAEPIASFSAQAPATYESGEAIAADDTISYTVYCSIIQGGPYNYSFPAPNLNAGTQIDVSACVQGEPGTYYFVSTASSSKYSSTSAYSNEASRTWTAEELGLVPNAPTLFTIQ